MRLLHGAMVSSIIMVLAGCGGVAPMANLVPCEGTVMYDGQALDHGSVHFDPVDIKVGQPAIGNIENGHFKMRTTVSASGVVVGKYKVAVLCPSKNPEPPEPGEMPPQPPNLIPEKYTAASTSGFEVEVKRGMAPVVLKLEKDKE